MVVVRSVTAFDVYVEGILNEKLRDRFKTERVITMILKTFPSQDKLDVLMKEVYGFSLKEVCAKEIRRLQKVRQERNDVVHRGTFSRKSSAEEAMNTVSELIRQIRKRIKRS